MAEAAKEISMQHDAQHVQELAVMAGWMRKGELTAAKARVAAVLAYPPFFKLNHKQRAAKAQVSERCYFYALHNPKVKAACVEFAKKHYGLYAGQVLHDYIAAAQDRTIDGEFFPGDRERQERIMEELGIFSKPEKGTNVNQTVNLGVEVVEAKRQENLKVGLDRFGVVVSDNSG